MRTLRALDCLRSFSPFRLPLILSCFALWCFAIPAVAKPATQDPSSAILPVQFAGWQLSGGVRQSDQAQAADAVNGDVLTECGFKQFESANYSNQGSQLSTRAIRFQDASGAYCGFTFYRRPGSIAEQIGASGAWDGSHVLFWQGNTLVDATFDHLTAMSAAQLRELAAALPQPTGTAGVAPSLPGYLPREDLESDSIRYALGPIAYSRGDGVLPPSLVDFAAGSAEAVTAAYKTREGEGDLTLLEYPTPQLAAARLSAITAFLKAGNSAQAAWPQPLAESHPDTILARRSGPIVAVSNGQFSAAEANKLIGSINFQADIVWNNPQGYVGEGSKVAKLLLGVFALFAVLGGTAVLLGLFFGGGRALIRVLRGKPASTVDETEIIRLNLRE